ncbi:metal ABC transporter ATP-binding protein [Candidatus Peregrinibacteria bacterium]|nr:MAG: metal ABC transporter ATP-binding protein [Candidatus Peregrinibacteria bacterium]
MENNPRQSLVEFHNVSLTNGGRTIVHNVNFSIAEGERIAIIGLNGSGKTTLLRLMLGIIKPTEGVIHRHLKKMGYVPQHFEFDRTIPLTVWELLKHFSDQPKSEVEKKLKEVGALHLIHQSIGGLSGGEMQRVLIANALLQHSELLVLDEATSALDVSGEKDFYCLLEDLRKAYNLAVVMVTHDLHLLEHHADRVFCMDQALCECGTPTEIENSKTFERLFGAHILKHSPNKNTNS